MKTLKSATTLAASVLFLAVTTAGAAPTAYQIDPSHSQVGFSVRHFFSKTPGRFNDFSGTIQYDDKKIENSSVDVTIQTASIHTDHDKRDAHLRGAEFFDAEKFPTLTFKSTKIVPGEGGKFKVAGDLTMHGITKPVVLDAVFNGAGVVGIGGRVMGSRAGFSATTKVDRKDYQILWNKTLDQGGTMLGDDVTINLDVEAIKGDAKPKEAPKDSKAAVTPPATTDKK